MDDKTKEIAIRPSSIKEACSYIEHGSQTFAVAMGGFIDDFQANWKNPEKQYSMISDEPSSFSDKDNILNRKVAAIAAQLATDFNLPKPKWTVASHWTIGEEYFDLFANASYDTKQLVKENALPEFAKRKIFEGDAVMLRDGVRKTAAWYREKNK